MIEELIGIGKEKDKKPVKNEAVFELKSIEDRVLKEIHGWSIYTEVNEKASKINFPPFDEDDLTNYLLLGNSETSTRLYTEQARGYYSGYLFSLLTKRNKEEGKNTSFYFDGKGTTFNFLFQYALGIENLTIANFNGLYIASSLRSESKINSLIIANCTGNHVASSPHLLRGEIGFVGLINVRPSINRRQFTNDIFDLYRLKADWAIVKDFFENDSWISSLGQKDRQTKQINKLISNIGKAKNPKPYCDQLLLMYEELKREKNAR